MNKEVITAIVLNKLAVNAPHVEQFKKDKVYAGLFPDSSDAFESCIFEVTNVNAFLLSLYAAECNSDKVKDDFGFDHYFAIEGLQVCIDYLNHEMVYSKKNDWWFNFCYSRYRDYLDSLQKGDNLLWCYRILSDFSSCCAGVVTDKVDVADFSYNRTKFIHLLRYANVVLEYLKYRFKADDKVLQYVTDAKFEMLLDELEGDGVGV